MRLVFAEPAAEDFNALIDYIALDNLVAAEKVFDVITAAARQLVDFPGMGRPGRVPGTRELPLPSLPYLLVYRVEVDTVTILAVFHSARDLNRALQERRRTIEEA